MATCNYNCDELSEFELVECGLYPKGGIDVVGVLDCTYDIDDFTDATETDAAIAANTLTLMKQVKATYTSEAVEGENPIACGADTVFDGINHTLTIKNFNVNRTNDDILQVLNGRKSYLVWRECQNSKIRVQATQLVNWTALPATVPESNREKQLYNITAKWSSGINEFPVLYNEPSGSYD